MLWRNLEKLGAMSAAEALKVGDTAADMQEGKNAGCLSVGVIIGSSTLGADEAELKRLGGEERRAAFDAARREYALAGADMVIDSIADLPALVESLNTDWRANPTQPGNLTNTAAL
jgi:phosphonoacetaldehyde hydrolase